MLLFDIEFQDIEYLDGYFSGTLYLYAENQRIVLDFGYDVEFESLSLQNCKNPLYNSFFQNYKPEQIADFRCKYGVQIKTYILEYLKLNYGYQEDNS